MERVRQKEREYQSYAVLTYTTYQITKDTVAGLVPNLHTLYIPKVGIMLDPTSISWLVGSYYILKLTANFWLSIQVQTACGSLTGLIIYAFIGSDKTVTCQVQPLQWKDIHSYSYLFLHLLHWNTDQLCFLLLMRRWMKEWMMCLMHNKFWNNIFQGLVILTNIPWTNHNHHDKLLVKKEAWSSPQPPMIRKKNAVTAN